jgi:non-ribosomal peptide synthetase component E (peptide arylation enzyme)
MPGAEDSLLPRISPRTPPGSQRIRSAPFGESENACSRRGAGGFNVYSAEVEQVLMKHPAVRDCAVIGLPDDKWGERVTAVLQAQVLKGEIKAQMLAR